MANSNNRIQNPEPAGQAQMKGTEMNDRDRLNDTLATQKYLLDGLNIAAWEASHDQLHQTYMTILNETHQGARDIYNVMFQMGHYMLEAEEQQKLDQTKQQFSGYNAQFSYTGQVQ